MKLIKNDILLNKHIQYKLKLVVIMIFLDINKYYLKSVGTSELALLWDRFFSNRPTLKKDSDGASALNQMRFFFAEFPLKRGFQPYQFKVDWAKT